MRNRSRAFTLLLALAVPALTVAHETLHEVVRAKGIAVRVFESDGDPLAGAVWEAYSPADPRTPWQTGRTDRKGWLAFVPDGPGNWRVRVIEKTGHGLDTRIDVAPAPVPAAAPPAGTAATSSAPVQVAATRFDEGGWAIALLVRPLLGVLVIVALFAALFLFYRRRGQG